MGFQLSPGVVVKEIDLTNAIPSVSTSGGAFVGQFAWGPVEAYTVISNRTKLEQLFGKPNDENYVDWFSCNNFLAYSNNLNVIRVIDSTAKNAVGVGVTGVVIKNQENYENSKEDSEILAAEFVAKYPGLMGNSLKVEMADANTFTSWEYSDYFDGIPSTSTYVDDLGGKNDELHIIVVDEGGLFTGSPGTVLETYPFLSKAKDSKSLDGEPNYFENIINQKSSYVWATNTPQGVSDLTWGDIQSISVTASGSGYLPATTSVAISGDGTGATAEVVISDYAGVTSVTPTSAGLGYTTGDTLDYTSTGGTGAIFTVTDDTAGGVLSVAISGSGVGFDDITFTGTVNAGTTVTTQAVFTVVLEGGVVSDITVTNSGIDYSTATVTVTDTGTGTGAIAVAVLNGDYGDDWGSPVAKVDGSGAALFKYLKDVYSKSFGHGDDSDIGAVGASELIVGWDMFRNSDIVDVSLLFVGDAGGSIASPTVIKHVLDNVVDFRRDALVMFSPRKSDVVGIEETIATANIIGFKTETINSTSSYGVMDSGWKYQYDVYNDIYRWIPLNADIAGLMARTDNITDPWFSPAGFSRGQIKNVISLAFSPNKQQRDDLYKNSINPVVSFTGEGVLLYGDRTLQSRTSAFQKINIRRLFIVLEKAIARAAKYQLFEFNDGFTRSSFKNMVEPYLREVQGRRGINEFAVVCDDTNNTPEVIDSQQFVADIYIKPTYSINFITLNFVAVRSGVEFEEIIGKF